MMKSNAIDGQELTDEQEYFTSPEAKQRFMDMITAAAEGRTNPIGFDTDGNPLSNKTGPRHDFEDDSSDNLDDTEQILQDRFNPVVKSKTEKGKKGVAIIIAVGGKSPKPPTKTLDSDEKKKMDDAWRFLKSNDDYNNIYDGDEDPNKVPLHPDEYNFIASLRDDDYDYNAQLHGLPYTNEAERSRYITEDNVNDEERAQVEMQQGKLTNSGEDPLPVVGQSGYDMRATEDRPIEETLDPAIQHRLAQREISGPLMSAKDQRPPLDFSDPPNPFQKAWAFLKNTPTHCPIHGDELQMIGDPALDDEIGPSWCPTCAELPKNEMGEQQASVLGER